MRAVAQRVRRARVWVEPDRIEAERSAGSAADPVGPTSPGAEVVGEMGPGLLALVGVARDDGPEDARQLAAKLVGLRVFPDPDDPERRMNLSLLDVRGTLGVVSQFTLLGDCRKGRRPSYAAAAAPEQAEPLIELLVAEARRAGAPVVTGRFRAMMAVELLNEGPVTLLVDTRRLF